MGVFLARFHGARYNTMSKNLVLQLQDFACFHIFTLTPWELWYALVLSCILWQGFLCLRLTTNNSWSVHGGYKINQTNRKIELSTQILIASLFSSTSSGEQTRLTSTRLAGSLGGGEISTKYAFGFQLDMPPVFTNIFTSVVGRKAPRSSAARWVCGYQQWLKSEPGGYALSERNSITGKWPVIETISEIPKPTLHQCCSWQYLAFHYYCLHVGMLMSRSNTWHCGHGQYNASQNILFIDALRCGMCREGPSRCLSVANSRPQTLCENKASGSPYGPGRTWVSTGLQVKTTLCNLTTHAIFKNRGCKAETIFSLTQVWCGLKRASFWMLGWISVCFSVSTTVQLDCLPTGG